MNNEELLKSIDALEAAGVFTKEEADAKRKPILDRIAKEKAEAEEAERVAKEKEEQDKKAKAEAAQGVIQQIEDAEGADFIEKAFEVLVPASGKANTLAGELVRAMMRIMYRDFNDGDLFYTGYGRETAGPAATFVAEKIPEAEQLLISIAEDGAIDDEYSERLKEVADAVETFIMDNPGTLVDKSEDDMLEADGDMWRDYEATFDLDISIPEAIEKHIDKGNITEDDLIDEIRYWEWADKTGDEDVDVNYYGEVYITGLTKEGYDDLFDNGYNWLEQYADTLTDEFGDPYFEKDDTSEYDIMRYLQYGSEDMRQKAAELLHTYISDGDIWDDFDGKDEDELAENIVGGFTDELSHNMHEFDADFKIAGITEEAVKNLLIVLGIIEEDEDFKFEDEED